MKKITQIIEKYVSDDGLSFDTEEDCILHEKHFEQLDPLFKKLTPKPSDRVLESLGVGYLSDDNWFIQQDLNLVNKIKNLISELVISLLNEENLGLRKDDSGNYVWGYAFGRYLDDIRTNNPVIKYLNSCASLMYCIDEYGKMYSQPYYAENPEKATIDITNKFKRIDCGGGYSNTASHHLY